jgi:hypothetical protein
VSLTTSFSFPIAAAKRVKTVKKLVFLHKNHLRNARFMLSFGKTENKLSKAGESFATANSKRA